MSRLSDILDSGLFTDSEGKPDYRTGKVRLEIKALMFATLAAAIERAASGQTIDVAGAFTKEVEAL